MSVPPRSKPFPSDQEMTVCDGLLIDLDGTMYEADAAVAGAAEAVEELRERGVPFLFTTNTSRMSRRAVAERLAGLGLAVAPERILTAPLAAARWLRREGCSRALLLLPESTHEDFPGIERVDISEIAPAEPDPAGGGASESGRAAAPDAVVVGDLGGDFTFDRLNAAFRALRAGARLVAVHKNRFWITEEGPTLDAGPFVVGLEYAARVEATLVGKPAPTFFELAAGALDLAVDRLAVVGDDPESDIRGARAAGLVAIEVETGKFDPERAAGAPPEERPHRRISSIAELPALFDALRS